MNGLALCAGIGGLELGLKLALGDAYRCVGYVEREAFAAAVLVARMEDAALDRAPIWDDLSTFDGKPWRGRVDLVSAGYPCQPFSVAGNRGGESDPRHLWPHVRRIIDEVEPGLVFLENVPGHLSLGFDSVLRDLAALGFDAEWGVVGAGDVGAPFESERIFVLAVANGVLGDVWVRDLEGWSGALLGSREGCDAGVRWWDMATAPKPSRVDDGHASAVDRLRALGNGVVPLAAAHAFRILAARAMNADQRRVAA